MRTNELPSSSSATVVGSVCPGRITVSDGSVSSTSMIECLMSANVVWFGARTPPTEFLNSVSPVKTWAGGPPISSEIMPLV